MVAPARSGPVQSGSFRSIVTPACVRRLYMAPVLSILYCTHSQLQTWCVNNNLATDCNVASSYTSAFLSFGHLLCVISASTVYCRQLIKYCTGQQSSRLLYAYLYTAKCVVYTICGVTTTPDGCQCTAMTAIYFISAVKCNNCLHPP